MIEVVDFKGEKREMMPMKYDERDGLLELKMIVDPPFVLNDQKAYTYVIIPVPVFKEWWP